MILEGLVTIKQDDKTLQLKNHLTAHPARHLLRVLMMDYLQNTQYNAATSFYLMKQFQIRLGSGITRVPLGSLTALETEKTILSGNLFRIEGDYNVEGPFDAIYTAQKDSTTLCSAFAGVTISTIVQDVKAIQSDPPASPVTGDNYIVASPATGDWTGNENKVATYNGATWDFVTPDTSYAASVTGTPYNIPYRFNGTEWIEIENKCREVGLFTYGFPSTATGISPNTNTFKWSHSGANMSAGNAYTLAAYISANGSNPDFNVGGIDICKALVVEWRIRISFTGDN